MKRRWKCYEGVNKKILSIVKSHKDITTSGIIVELKKQEIKVTWKLVNSHLEELEEKKKVKRVQIGEKHIINFWK